MRVLLDENMPGAIAPLLPGHEVLHVDDLELKSLSNGELLAHARAHFDAFVTLDRGILHQHSHAGHDLRIVVVRVANSRQATVLARAEDLIACLAQLQIGTCLEL